MWTFRGTGSSDVEGPIASYSINFGDNSAVAGSGAPNNLNHTYANVGTYTVTLYVTDGHGQVSAPDSTQITVS
jgi:PKD repeat protein